MDRKISSPGDLVRVYALRKGWRLGQYNIIVEGENDQKYFELAAKLYRQKNGRELIGKRLSIFPTGPGEEGGAYGIQQYFPTLRNLIDEDPAADGARVFFAVALLDSDPVGKQTYNALTARHTKFLPNRDVFLLYRRYPRTTQNHEQLTRQIKSQNIDWKDLDCEIEDLLSLELLQCFFDDHSGCTIKAPKFLNGAHHFKFTKDAKAPLFRFVEENAILKDLDLLIEALKSFRFYMRLDPDGDIPD